MVQMFQIAKKIFLNNLMSNLNKVQKKKKPKKHTGKPSFLWIFFHLKANY